MYRGWNTAGDYLFNHEIVARRVAGARVIRNTRSPSTDQVIIDHRPYNIARDLLVQLNRGDYVEAEVGTASRTIVPIRGVTH